MSNKTDLLPKGPKAGLLIFAKTPAAGTVKTRLQPPLSDGDCLDLHQALVRHTLDQMRPLQERMIGKKLFLTGDPVELEVFASVCGIGRDFGLLVWARKEFATTLFKFTTADENGRGSHD